MVMVIDPFVAGISGDMILSSFVDLGADKNKILEGIRSSEKFLNNSKIKNIEFAKIKKHGINSTSLILDLEENITERKGSEIKKAIKNSLAELSVSKKAKIFAESCIDTLIDAESKIHGISPDSVHFHEASSMDTLVDIIGVTIAIDDLGILDEEIFSMPVCVGGGTVSFSHGTMTNPASAVLEIFKGSSLTIRGSNAKGELTTPTGASILVNLTKKGIDYYPLLQVDSVGYGAGKKDFEDFANVLKIVKGVATKGPTSDSVILLETNVDDVSGEIMGNLIEKIMNIGAKDVFVSSGITKKGRPANKISIICDDESLDSVIETLISETGTLGVRVTKSNRIIVPRSNHQIKANVGGKIFPVKYKKSNFKGKSSFKIEFDDLKNISDSLNLSIKETESLIRKEIKKEDDLGS